jgi:hypothetical protein
MYFVMFARNIMSCSIFFNVHVVYMWCSTIFCNVHVLYIYMMFYDFFMFTWFTCDVIWCFLWCSVVYMWYSRSIQVMFYDVFLCSRSIQWCSMMVFVMFTQIHVMFYDFFIFIWYIGGDVFCDVRVVYMWCSRTIQVVFCDVFYVHAVYMWCYMVYLVMFM